MDVLRGYFVGMIETSLVDPPDRKSEVLHFKSESGGVGTTAFH